MDFTEFQEGLKECDINVTTAVAKECFNRIDSDSSGTINFDEFLIALRVCTFSGVTGPFCGTDLLSAFTFGFKARVDPIAHLLRDA